MPSARPITDTCANYNAFGRDPDGLIAYLAGICFGPRWVPPYTVQQFVGRLEPPRYGPPAPYQIPCLPEGFIPRSPPNILGMTAEELNNEDSWIDPPSPFDPLMFEALRPVKSSKRTKKVSKGLKGAPDRGEEDGYETEPVNHLHQLFRDRTRRRLPSPKR